MQFFSVKLMEPPKEITCRLAPDIKFNQEAASFSKSTDMNKSPENSMIIN
jgi:hypothetical protein